MEFAEGDLGLIKGALDYSKDVTRAGDDDPVLGRRRPAATRSTTSSTGSARARSSSTRPTARTPVIVPDDLATPLVDERCENTTTTKCYKGQGPRMPGEVLTLGTPGAYTIKWICAGHQGQRRGRPHAAAAGRGRRRGRHRRRHRPGDARRSRSARRRPSARSRRASPKDYTASTTANVISTAGDATLSVADPARPTPGKLVNGAFALPQVLQASASSMGGTGHRAAAVGGSAAPTHAPARTAARSAMTGRRSRSSSRSARRTRSAPAPTARRSRSR